jgi:hypothetical protein
METNNKYRFDLKFEYLKLVLKISKIRQHGDEPPRKLLQRAYKIGRLAGINEEELKNI